MDVAGELDVRIDRSAQHTVVRLAGDLDLGSCERMREAVAQARKAAETGPPAP